MPLSFLRIDMRIKNTSDGVINLASGKVESGKCGEATDKEYKFLRGIGRCEVAKMVPKKSVSSGGLGDK